MVRAVLQLDVAHGGRRADGRNVRAEGLPLVEPCSSDVDARVSGAHDGHAIVLNPVHRGDRGPVEEGNHLERLNHRVEHEPNTLL